MGSYSGVASRKGVALLARLNAHVRYESSIEEQFLRLADRDPRVQQVRRAEPIAVYRPDGTQHQYTADFEVMLESGVPTLVECKPQALLRSVLREAQTDWQLRQMRLAALQRTLWVVTETGYSQARLEQATAYGGFYGVVPSAEVAQTVERLLRERGPLPWEQVRGHLLALNLDSPGRVHDTLAALVAQHRLLLEDAPRAACRVDLPGGRFPPPTLSLGQPLGELLAELPSWPPESTPSPVSSSTRSLEAKFLSTLRGTQAARLFALYPDPTVPLGRERAQALADQVGGSVRGVYRFRQALLDAGAPGITLGDLVPSLAAGPGRKAPRQVALEVQTVIEQEAMRTYLVPLGTPGRSRNLADLHQMIQKTCEDRSLSAPSYTTVQRHLERIAARDPVRSTRLRHGHELADQLSPRQGHLRVKHYGELVAIDCTPADVFVHADKLQFVPHRAARGPGQPPIRARLVTVVDVATSQVLRSVAFRSGIGAPEILRVLRELFLGDDQGLRSAGVREVPQGRGLPLRIRVDSGREFVNVQVHRVLEHLGVECLQRHKGSRHHGGIEERSIGTLTHLHHLLPGTTTHCIEARGEYDAQKGAQLSFAELDAFHQRLLERHNGLCAPLREISRQQHAQVLLDTGLSCWRSLTPTQEEYVRTRMHPQTQRLCEPAGIKVHNLWYRAPALEPLIVGRRRVEVQWDPDDISVAEVVHPDSGALIRVTARLPDGLEVPVSLAEWREMHARIAHARRQAQVKVATPQQIYQQVRSEHAQRRITPQRSKTTAPSLESEAPIPTIVLPLERIPPTGK